MGSTLSRTAVAHRPGRPTRGTPWPFMAPSQPAQPIAVSDFGVGVPRRQEVEFADGSRVWLLRVEHQGVPELFLRELGAPAAALHLEVDLRDLVPALADDLPKAATRDVPGIVHFSLRGRFSSAPDFIQAAAASRGAS